MQKREIACLALGLMGIYCLVQALPLIRGLYFLALSILRERNDVGGGEVAMALATVLPLAFMGAAGAMLLLFSAKLADRITPGNGEERISVRASSQRVQAIAFAVAGVLIFASAIPPTCMAAGNIFSVMAYCDGLAGGSPSADPMFRTAWVSLVASVIQLLLGVSLFVGARGLSRVWHRARSKDFTLSDGN